MNPEMLKGAQKLSPEKLLLLQRRLKGVAGNTTETRAIPLRAHQGPAPLSIAQNQMWLINQMAPGSAAYNLPFGYRLSGALNSEALDSALNAVIQRHEILRTTFSQRDGKAVQIVHPAWKLRLNRVDLRHVPADQREFSLQKAATSEAIKPFDLSNLPLLRVFLFIVGDQEHVLFINVHHILADGLSFAILLQEVNLCYTAFRAGQLPALQPLPIQYSDFASWECQEIVSKDHQAQSAFWKDQLKGELPALELPWDKSRPAVRSFKGANVFLEIPAQLCGELKTVAAAQDSTFFMVMLAAFYAILHRYSGASDIIVGTPVANRAKKEVQPLIGNFLNVLALRNDVSGDLSFNQLLRKTREVALNAFSHSEVSFTQVVEQLHFSRDTSRNPIFQTMLQVLPQGQPHLSDLKVDDFHFDPGIAQFDLSLHLYEISEGFRGRFEYCTDLLNQDTVERLSVHFLMLLRQITANPEQAVSSLKILPEAERCQILEEWNNTAMAYPNEKTVHALFEEQVARTPNAIAVECNGHRVTYTELNNRANAIAWELRQKGVKEETPVGIYIERSIDMVVVVLGVLKANGYYIPLDPAFPKDRLAYMVADAQIPVLLTQSGLTAELPEHHAQVVHVDKIARAPSEQFSPPFCNQIKSTNLAYTLFTSGSTGRPKGVQITHQAVVNFLHSMQHKPGMQADDVLLAVTTLSFDIAGLELFLPLVTGAKVVIASREETLDGARLIKSMRAAAITVMQATPATWRMLVEAGWTGDPKLKILCGGEAIDRSLADQLLSRCGELWNMYGPTETTIWSTTERLLSGQPITIGRPIANTQIYILDSKGQPTPTGVIGELFIGGDGVARGYLNRPELTADKFIRDPFSQNDYRKLYRTGDLAHYRKDGRIEFLGRSDFQIKIRGFRIEVGEIETALTSIDRVARAVVVVREDTPGDKRLIAYIVPKGNARSAPSSADGSNIPDIVDVAKLRNELRATLPDYMIPSAFVMLDTLPLTPNGKVDRKTLPEPGKTSRLETKYEAPIGPTEIKLAEIMARLLQLPRIGRSDDFFSSGGYSILAVSLFNEIESIFGKRIPLATLFHAPTVAALAAELEAESVTAKSWASLVPIQPTGTQSRFFCIHGAGGNILLYRDLVRYLGADYPFYGLQSQGLDKLTKPLATVEEMAEHYINEIQALQPEGPYCLGGYCLGGTIAYEMAQQLRQKGHDVALLALFDTYNFTRIETAPPFTFLRQKISFHARNIASLSWKDLGGYLSSKARIASDGELRALVRTLLRPLQLKRSGNKSHPQEANVQKINDAAAAAYRPKPYPGQVTIFKPKINYNFMPDPKLGWNDTVTGALDVVELPVNPHAMLVEPFVQHLALSLAAKLNGVKLSTRG
jgi:amino acid adenylation domain-containing protein